MQELRANKAAMNIAKSIYYLVFSTWGYMLLKETNFLPPMLGGTGSIRNSFVNTPFFTPVDGLLTYSLVSMGYYIGDLVDTVFQNQRQNDFWEMILHHLLTITLFGGMIMQNQMRIGVMISFIHNSSDILAGITRCFSQTTMSTCSLVSFLTCVAVWIYFRNFALPILTYACWTMATFPPGMESYYLLMNLLSSFLTALCAMHVYWTILFFKMILSFMHTGAQENIINKVKKQECTNVE